MDKNFLNEIRHLDNTINRKLSELEQLKSLSEKVNQTYSDMPRGSSESTSRLEEVIVKIIDLSHEINADIDKLVDMKCEARSRIEALENPEHRNVLSLRYLCGKTFEAIAVELNYSYQWVCVLHGRVVGEVE